MTLQIRSVLLALLLVAAGLRPAGARAQSPPLRPSAASPAVPGEAFTLVVAAGEAVQPVENLFGVSFELGYDAAVFSVRRVEEGELLRQGLPESASLLVFADRLGEEPAPVALTRVRPQPGVSGYGAVAVFEVEVAADAAEGSYTFDLSDVEAVAPDGAPLPLAAHSGSVTVAAANQSPVAEGVLTDRTRQRDDGPFAVDLGSIFTDPDGDELTYEVTTNDDQVVTADVDGGTLTLTPVDEGETEIVVTAQDGRGGAATLSITVTVTAVASQPPHALADVAETAEEAPVQIDVLANDTDPEGDVLSVVQVDRPGAGAVAVEGGTIIYTPRQDFHGTDEFSYLVQDAGGGAAEAAVTVTVLPVNDAPVIVSVPDTAATQGAPYSYSLEAADVDGDALTLTAPTVPAWLSLADAAGGTATLAGTPANGDVGTHEVVLRAGDGAAATEQRFAIVVADVNDVPVAAGSLADVERALADGAFEVDLDPVFTDPDDDPLAFSAISTEEAVATAVVAGSTLVVTPVAAGTTTVDVAAEDGRGGRAFTSFTLTVVEAVVNAAPVAVADTANTTGGAPLVVDVLANDADPDGDTLTVTGIPIAPAHGTAVLQDGTTVRYAPEEGFRGEDAFTYAVTDGRGGTAEASVHVVVASDPDGVPDEVEDGAPNGGDGNGDGVPDAEQENVTSLVTTDATRYVTLETPPGTELERVVATPNPSPQDTPEDAEFPVDFYDFGVGGLGVGEATTVTFHLPEGVEADTYYKYGPTSSDPAPHWYEFLYDGTTGARIDGRRVVLHFVDGARGDDDLAADGRVTDPGAPALKIAPDDSDADAGSSNRAPTASDDAAETPEDVTVTVDVLANDADPDGDALDVVAVADPENGSASIAEDGFVRYVPAADFHGTDRFTYTADDGEGRRAEAAVTVTVTPVDDAPVFQASGVFDAPEADGHVAVAGEPGTAFVVDWTPAHDPDGDALSYRWTLALSADFSEPLLDVEVGARTGYQTTYGEIGTLLTAHGVVAGAEVTLHQRVTASDGVLLATQTARFTATRGALTAADAAADLPEEFTLGVNYPNPFNPVTHVPFALPEAARVRLVLYDTLGRVVRTLVDGPLPAGRHRVEVQAADLPSGVYLYRLEAGPFQATRSMLLLK